MVHQHFTSIEGFTVEENVELALGHRVRAGEIDWSQGLLAGLPRDSRVEALGVALRQRLEIAKALVGGAEVLLLDEPSAVLAPSDVDQLLAIIREFAGNGGAVALVTHKLREVFAVADRVTVLRNGAVTLRGMVAEQTEVTLATAMIGEQPDPDSGTPVTSGGGLFPEPLVRIGEIDLRRGELVGIAAIEGQGQRALLARIAGLPVGALPRDARVTTPISVSGTAAFVPEDRTTEGLVPEMSLTENLVLGRDHDPVWRSGPWLRWSAARAHAENVIREYQVRAPHAGVSAATLSGGNQQKLLLARALESRPDVLVVENPARGLDIRATEEIHTRLRDAARRGVLVLVYSTDLDDVLELGQRILVVREGQVREAPAPADRHTIGRLMLGLE
jgi:simple sugar transport system ATP-binding protein